MKQIAMLLLISILTASCASAVQVPPGTVEPVTTATPTSLPTATPWKLVEEGVVVQAADGLGLTGTFYAPADTPPPWPAVMLLHMIYSSSRDWGDFPKQLTEAGYAVFNLDLRGHGKTGGEMDWDQARDDLQRVWNYLAARPDVDGKRISIIGASMGANMALVQASENPEVRAVGLLSPGLNYYMVTTPDKLMDYGSRPVLIIASDEDEYAAGSSQQLADMAKGEAELIMYSQAGHGTAMFQNEQDLPGTIIDWLDRYLKP